MQVVSVFLQSPLRSAGMRNFLYVDHVSPVQNHASNSHFTSNVFWILSESVRALEMHLWRCACSSKLTLRHTSWCCEH